MLPIVVGEAPGGALLLAGEAPPADGPAAPSRGPGGAPAGSGRLLDTMRMRANLERAMAQILATDERMLGRMGLDIHDGPTQQLSVAMLEVQLLEADLADAEAQGKPPPESLRPSLGRIYETVGGALHEMRELIGHLRPAQFEDRRLTDILGDAIVAFEARTDCRVTPVFEGEFAGERRLDHAADHALPDPAGDAHQRRPPRPRDRGGRAGARGRGRRHAWR